MKVLIPTSDVSGVLFPLGEHCFGTLEPFGGLVVIVTPILPDSFGNNFERTSALRLVPEFSFRLDKGIESSLLLLSSAGSESTMFRFLCFLPLALLSFTVACNSNGIKISRVH